jgi:predicted ATPase
MLPEERIIISGGPGFGKTTLILELEKAGFQCVHESSREIIHEQMQSGGNFLPWKDLVKLFLNEGLSNFRRLRLFPVFSIVVFLILLRI